MHKFVANSGGARISRVGELHYICTGKIRFVCIKKLHSRKKENPPGP